MVARTRSTIDRATGERMYLAGLREARAAGYRKEDAHDVAGSATANAIKAWSDFVDEGEGSFEKWFTTIARNLIRDRKRRERTARRKAPLTHYSEQEARLAARPLAPETVAINLSVQAKRLKLYDTLPERLGAAVSIVAKVNAKEISRAEAANLLGINVHSYDKLAQDVKAALRQAIIDQGIDINDLHETDASQERRSQ